MPLQTNTAQINSCTLQKHFYRDLGLTFVNLYLTLTRFTLSYSQTTCCQLKKVVGTIYHCVCTFPNFLTLPRFVLARPPMN